MVEYESKKYKFEFWFVFLTIVGYVFISAIPIPLKLENARLITVPYRFFIFIFSLYIIWKNFSLHKIRNISFIAFTLFWIYYLIKANYSFQNDPYDIMVLQTWNEIYTRIGIILFVPFTALMLIDYRKLNLPQLTRFIFYSLVGLLLANFIYGLFTMKGFFQFPSIFSVYYISYGHYGTSLAIISLFILLFAPDLGLKKPLLILTFLFGCFSILIGEARSPFLALGTVSFYLLMVKNNRKLIIIFFILLFLLFLGIWFYGNTGNDNFPFIKRTYQWIFEGNNSERTPLFEKSLKIFSEHPLFGGRILYQDGMYPHNIFLELFSATGIFGFLLYFLKFVPVVKKMPLFINKWVNKYYILFFALFIQYFVLAITSYNLFSIPELIHLSGIVIGISLNELNEKTKSNNRSRNQT